MKRVYLMLLLLMGLLLISSSQVQSFIVTKNDRTAFESLYRVQLGLERYAACNPTGEYPPDLQTLIEGGYVYLGRYEWPAGSG